MAGQRSARPGLDWTPLERIALPPRVRRARGTPLDGGARFPIIRSTMKYAFCNEPFKDQSFEETCRALSEIGYDGVELAPFTFGEDIRKIDVPARVGIRKTAEDHGLEVGGVHGLL